MGVAITRIERSGRGEKGGGGEVEGEDGKRREEEMVRQKRSEGEMGGEDGETREE